MNKRIPIIGVILCLITSCTTYKKINKPEGNDWILCAVCKGYGRIESFDINDNESIKSSEKTGETVGCILSPFLSNELNDYEKKKTGSGYLPPENFRDPSPQNMSGQNRPHHKVKQIKCHNCDGKGWMRSPLSQ